MSDQELIERLRTAHAGNATEWNHTWKGNLLSLAADRIEALSSVPKTPVTTHSYGAFTDEAYFMGRPIGAIHTQGLEFMPRIKLRAMYLEADGKY